MYTKPPMGWNSWNTFGSGINEELIRGMADAIVEKGYRDAGYEYVIIDDCWALKERVDGKLTPDPRLFPGGMRALADYIHGRGLKFGMYSCAGFRTCAGYPSSYGHEFEDARQFAEWGVDYLKYDFCNFPASGDARNAYLTMAMALRHSGRDIFYAACNWGEQNPAQWMRSRGANSYRSTQDIFDRPESYRDIFMRQAENIEGNAADCWNDLDMLVVGMKGYGHVGVGGCTDAQYLQHFAMWAFLGSPLIIGADIRSLDDVYREILQNRGLIALNQDSDCRPPFLIGKVEGQKYTFGKLLSDDRVALAFFNVGTTDDWSQNMSISFDDLGIHSESGLALRLTDAVTGEDLGVHADGYAVKLAPDECRVLIGKMVSDQL